MDSDAFIVGTTMRNQSRKLYPELMESFGAFLRKAPKEVTKKSYLYIHSTFPDLGFHFPRLLKKYALSSKVLFTYHCLNCQAVFPSFFRDIKTVCEECEQKSAYQPTTTVGVDRTTLARILNTFDVYAQYSNSEGFGLPAAEAAACGIPVFGTDYSAIHDVLDKTRGYPVKVAKMITGVDFGTERALPDNNDFVDKLIKYVLLPQHEKTRRSEQARDGVLKWFTWERVAKVWSDAIRSVPRATHEWDESPRFHSPVAPSRGFEDNSDFVRWAIENVLGQPESVDSYLALRLTRDLTNGVTPITIPGSTYASENSALGFNNNHKTFSTEDVLKELQRICQDTNEWEKLRYESTQLRREGN
jgi:hypothetical protein